MQLFPHVGDIVLTNPWWRRRRRRHVAGGGGVRREGTRCVRKLGAPQGATTSGWSGGRVFYCIVCRTVVQKRRPDEENILSVVKKGRDIASCNTLHSS